MKHNRRDIELSVRADGEKKTIRASVSSEEPVITFISVDGEMKRAWEVLDHGDGSIDFSRAKHGLPVLDGHGGDQIGIIQIEISNRRLEGEIRFGNSARAKEIEADVLDGIRHGLSIGYRVKPGSYKPDGEREGVPVYRAMRWTPLEVSFVPVPADVTVGVGRDAKIEDDGECENETTTERKRTMSEETKKQITPEEVVEIYRLARAYDMEPGEADDHIRSGGTLADWKDRCLKRAAEVLAKRKAEKPASMKPVVAEAEATEKRSYNLLAVLRHLAGDQSVDIGFEREISAEVARRTGRNPQGILIPHDVNVQVRAADFLKTGNGSAFVATQIVLPMIEALRAKLVLADAGATVISGLVGDIALPKGGAVTGGWVDGEGGAASGVAPSVSQVPGTPHTASGYTDISRRLLLQSSVDVRYFVEEELRNALARLIETAAFAGSNSSGQPKGLINWTGINNPSVTTDAPTRAQILSFISDVMADNADSDNMRWIMRPEVWALLAATPRGEVVIKNVAGTENVGGGPVSGFMADPVTRTIEGYTYHVTTLCPAKSLFFGDWKQLVIALWSGVDVLADPYSGSTSGLLRVVALQDCDILVRHPQAFAYNSAMIS